MANKEVIRPPFKSDVNPVITEAGFIFFQQVAQWINTLLTPPEWIEVTSFLNSWVNYGQGYAPAAYCKDVLGFVHLRGLIKSGTVNLPAFTLPAGFRPLNRYLYGVISNSIAGRVDVLTSGEVAPFEPSDNIWVQLDGITFYAG